MLQTIIVVTIIFFAAIWVLKIAHLKVKGTNGPDSACGCGCSGCGQIQAEQTDRDRSTTSLKLK